MFENQDDLDDIKEFKKDELEDEQIHKLFYLNI